MLADTVTLFRQVANALDYGHALAVNFRHGIVPITEGDE